MTAYYEFGKLCGEILNASNKVQSVAVINKMGRPVEHTSRAACANQFPAKMTEMLYMQSVLQVSMGKDFDDHYGPINYYVSERTNATMLTFPLGDHVVFLTASKNTSPISLAKRVAAIITKSAKETGLKSNDGMLVSA